MSLTWRWCSRGFSKKDVYRKDGLVLFGKYWRARVEFEELGFKHFRFLSYIKEDNLQFTFSHSSSTAFHYFCDLSGQELFFIMRLCKYYTRLLVLFCLSILFCLLQKKTISMHKQTCIYVGLFFVLLQDGLFAPPLLQMEFTNILFQQWYEK